VFEDALAGLATLTSIGPRDGRFEAARKPSSLYRLTRTFDESGGRESNPRSQLGKIGKAELANEGELNKQVSDLPDVNDRPRTDTDAP
jgi:hypothetical protein